jgi:hypothetical protein
MCLKIKKVKDGWIVYNPAKPKAHTHFKNKESCYFLIKLIKQGVMPNNPYLQESAKRLLTKKEFRRLESVK